MQEDEAPIKESDVCNSKMLTGAAFLWYDLRQV